jgi:hypothetical protein
MTRHCVALSMSFKLLPRFHNPVPHMLVPQVCIKAVLAGVKSFTVGIDLLALVAMACLEMSGLASPHV